VKAKKLYQRLIELSFDGVGIHVDGKIVFINDKARRFSARIPPNRLWGAM
jgi:hypothetical protein